MFPSTALFHEIDCPFLRWGRCNRPYCLYNHGKDNTSGVTTTELGDPEVTSANGASHTNEDSYACLEELERINKEIEAVKCEVEKEQKRLSRYQTSQSLVQTDAGLCSEKYLRTTNSKAKDQNGNHLRYKKPASTTSGLKYVVDRARPKTDLEYDPCSNFSADLLSSCSVDCKLKSTDKADTEHSLKNNRTGKNVQPLSCHFDDSDDEGTLVIDIPPSAKDQVKCRTKQKGKSTPHLHEGNCAVNNDLLANDQTKPRQHKEKLSSDGLQSHEIKNRQGDQENKRTSAKPVMIPQEQESSEGELVIDVSPLEDGHKLSKQCGTTTKELPTLCPISDAPAEDGKEANEGPLNKRVMTGKHSVKETKPFLEDLTEVPVSEAVNSTNLNMEAFVIQKEEKAHNMENVLHDISTCLDNLRSESERIKCSQDVKMLPVSYVYGDEYISSQSPAFDVQDATSEAEPQIDISSYTQKSEVIPSIKISQEQALQQYFAMVSSQSFPSSLPKVEEHRCGPHSQNLAKTSWPTIPKSPIEPFVQNMPAYVSGIDTGTVFAPTISQLNLRATVAQKLSTSIASFPVPCAIPVPSQTFASAGSNKEAIVIDSSSDEELRYSDLDLSESDPMEECYRIFMEANQNEGPVVQFDPPEELLEAQETEKSNSVAVLKKRVAHVAKFEPASKSKAQIIVPLREGGSQLTFPSRNQLCQRRAAILTAAVKGCQPQAISSAPKKVYTPNVIHSTTVQNSCVGIFPVAATVQLGTNLHFIVPEGNCSLPLTLIPTTIPIQRPPQPPPSVQLSQTLHPPQPANYTPAKAMGVKRKAKVRQEVGVKVPHDVRQRYVNLFVEEFLKSSVTVQDAFEKALAEEKNVYDRSINKLKYLSIAVNALKRLKNQNILPAKAPSERDQHVSRGNVPLNTQALQGPGDLTLYEQLKEHVLSEDMLRVNNFPRKNKDKADFAIQYGDTKKGISDLTALKRICCRCGATFSVDKSGKHTRREECNYHYGKVLENRVPGGVETRYSCCENAVGSPGCQVFNLHVHDAISLQGFVNSPQSSVAKACPGVFAVDTQICYTTQGLELARVTVVNSSLQVIFDSFVKPDKDVIDYNTRFSGISEDDVKGTNSSLRDVQAALLSFINADTILIGHGLENDLTALKIIHSTVIDTSVVFPHRLGLPHKRELNSLTADYLRRIIQESVVGHDTREDATACMELMLWRVKEDSKVKRW
ncbi:RNA exonuclease 1 homolog isoform X1 [Sinocyclocheilus rhinocerous]|uniref:RNA exonuclease 1 homolog isoform X1 n=1 Tax=Sinocyclocheilus rhinocerous TaxID=307959 RepID=UPI0007B893B7|nr:PREDICTED: RNA exonuclease 1 homolog isoform X1 [Sinocyclocheilus rhinocerous]